MPRKKIIVEAKKIQRKCCMCEKRRNVAFTKTVVPSFKYEMDIPVWEKKSQKPNRVDLKGDRKCDVYHYCKECAETQDRTVQRDEDGDLDFK